jgi:hypothetical protein
MLFDLLYCAVAAGGFAYAATHAHIGVDRRALVFHRNGGASHLKAGFAAYALIPHRKGFVMLNLL